MPLTVPCPTCAGKLRLPDFPDGQYACPRCGSLIDAANLPPAMPDSIREAPISNSSSNPPVAPADARPQPTRDEFDERPPARGLSQRPKEKKDSTTAVLLEVLPGFFLWTFGIGHIYAGNVGTGLAFMFGFWALSAVNVGLAFCGIGFFTAPACWLLFMILSPILAAQACKETPTQQQ